MRAIQFTDRDRPATLDPGPAPMLQWIKIEHLVLDDDYQRDLKAGNWKAIRRIVADFKWSRFSPVFCAPIEGGLFAVIDGQHRAHAAAMCGFDSVPCQVVQMSRDEQAASFAAVNGMVTKITSLNLHKAALAAGETWAVEAHRIAEAAGCQLMVTAASSRSKKPGQIYAPKSFAKVLSIRPADYVISALSVLMRAEGYCDEVEIWDTSVLLPLVLGMTAEPQYLAEPGIVKCLEDFDVWRTLDSFDAELKRRLRLGLPYEPKKLQLEIATKRWIAKTFHIEGAK